ncbi:hypothetical protein [Phocaeicola coprophilus]|uniref:hypothetical protein n=1 Tax=Phocaeicola coprophilus TaxID=387090 RepID=UPI0022DEF667|nr:hypothetical protein [Phocaeicola coprophilus]
MELFLNFTNDPENEQIALLCLAGISIQTQAQQSNFLQEYRAKVKEYNQDIKTAGYAVSFVR